MKIRLVLGVLLFAAAACSPTQPTAVDRTNLAGETANPSQATAINPSGSQAQATAESSPTASPDAAAALPPAETENPYQAEMDKCWSFESSQDTDNAILCWENLLERIPNNYEVLNHLANQYGALKGDWKRGIEYGKRAAEVAPTTKDKITTLLNLAGAYQSLSDWASSIEVLSQVIEIGDPNDPHTVQAYLYLAAAYKESSRMDQACQLFNKAIELGTKINDKSIMNMEGQKKFYCP